MCLMIILKDTKSKGSTIPLDDTFFEKPQAGSGVCQIDLPAVLVLKLSDKVRGMEHAK